MKKNIIILDGYNVIHQIPELARHLDNSLEVARDTLCRLCTNWLESRKDISLFYIVFDGKSHVLGHQAQLLQGIRVIYTHTGETADTRILNVIEEQKNDCCITVISEDNFVIRQSRFLGAKIMSVSDFTDTLKAQKRKTNRTQEHSGDKHLSAQQQKDINDSLKKYWGIE